METYKPFSIIIVPFPFTDSPHSKRRPALILSSENYQKQTGHISLLMITSAKHSKWFGDHQILDLKPTGLTAESLVRQKIFTIDRRLIIDCIGKLETKDKKAVVRNLCEHLKF